MWHAFCSWSNSIERAIHGARLARNAAYLVRPDGHVALADSYASATAITSYLDTRKLIPWEVAARVALRD